ncbi:MAG: uroporphyrinogen-III C-methyltransferase [Caldimicrobium sp.]|nr:uroporphyrinogen-III C-methyltransferase [Caldimicrobium sp.]MCX7874392.1 uroporphyrinogen-III C-methyltransferase [Caldimicrobium sp.]MDW8094022.1 uroporphyrinogen-III C-methyltransferase [Caldimicrobium sp.]
MSKVGKVYLVGAGPGDPGLLTLKGKSLLEKAEVLIYDYLANPELLRFCSPNCEFIYVGKRGGDHTLPQEEINKLLVRKAKEGKLVVRLKGGDPFLFGRGGEEIEELVREKVPFEVVPGITSAIAVPAYAGIPVTHRTYTSTLAIVTGHEAEDKEESRINFSALSKIGTVVFLMGVKNLPLIVENLLREGKPSSTPCAVIQWGTIPSQKTAEGTLENIVEKVKEKGIKAPAIIIVGEVVKLREHFNWFERKPLFGRTIIITRTREQASKLKDGLSELGAKVIEVPTIEVKPLWEESYRNIYYRLSDYHWLIFTSENGVKHFFEGLFKLNLDVRALGSVKIAVIGPATKQALWERGIRADLFPEGEFTQEGLVKAFQKVDLLNKKVLLVRAKIARDLLPEALREQGAKIEILPIYETVLPETSGELLKEAFSSKVDMITFTSSSTAENFFKLLRAESLSLPKDTFIASIGPITSQTLKNLGYMPHVEAKVFTIPGLIEAIEDFFKERQG